jgi:hypothetical protein
VRRSDRKRSKTSAKEGKKETTETMSFVVIYRLVTPTIVLALGEVKARNAYEADGVSGAH